MNKALLILTLITVLLFNSSVIAADKVVVIPLNTCSDGLTKCSGQCVDTMNNPSFCGDCTTDCGADNYCSNGSCQKRPGSTCVAHTECISGKCSTGGTCAIQGKFVFVSSDTFNGNFGELTSADQECQALADAAGLPGQYMAWLGDSTGSPSTRFTQSTSPYIRVDGVIVASDWEDLTDDTIKQPINLYESGVIVPISERTWTGTGGNGYAYKPSLLNNHCNNWTADTDATQGIFGETNSVSGGWAGAAITGCDTVHHIYCFQQN